MKKGLTPKICMLCFVIINMCLGPVGFSFCLETLCIHVWTFAGLDFRKTLSNITSGPAVTHNFFDLVPHRTWTLLMLEHAFHVPMYAFPVRWPPFDSSCCRHIAARQDHYEVVVWVHYFVVIVNPPPSKVRGVNFIEVELGDNCWNRDGIWELGEVSLHESFSGTVETWKMCVRCWWKRRL